MRSASGATTVPMSRPSATQSPDASSDSLASDHRRAHLRVGRRARGELTDLGLADRLRHVLAVEQHALADVDLQGREIGLRIAQQARAPRSGTSHPYPGT